jgi:hypothetical protein
MALVMKNHLSAPLTGLALALSITLASNQPSQAQAQSRQFTCALRDKYPVTVVRTPTDRDPKQVLEQLLNTRVAAGGEAVYLSGDQEGHIKPTINRDGTASVDIDQVINSNSEPIW